MIKFLKIVRAVASGVVALLFTLTTIGSLLVLAMAVAAGRAEFGMLPVFVSTLWSMFAASVVMERIDSRIMQITHGDK